MRAFGRDLIRGGHYGQRSCEPRQQAEHMAAPTNAAKREKTLANSDGPATASPACPLSGDERTNPGRGPRSPLDPQLPSGSVARYFVSFYRQQSLRASARTKIQPGARRDIG